MAVQKSRSIQTPQTRMMNNNFLLEVCKASGWHVLWVTTSKHPLLGTENSYSQYMEQLHPKCRVGSYTKL